jgi:hypothetical protein
MLLSVRKSMAGPRRLAQSDLRCSLDGMKQGKRKYVHLHVFKLNVKQVVFLPIGMQPAVDVTYQLIS